MTVSRSITLEWASSHYIYGEHDGVRVRISVTCAENIDREIFAYRMLTTDPTTGEKAAHFSHVCSPPDLVEWPRNAIDPHSSPQWVRLSFVDILVRTVAEAEEFVRLIQADVLRLKRTFDNMGALEDPTTVTYGSGCADDADPDPEDSEGSEEEDPEYSVFNLTVSASSPTMVFSSQGGWVIEGDGADSGLDTPSSYAAVSLQPGTSSSVLQISGFNLGAVTPTDEIIGISVRVRLRDETESEDSLGSVGLEQQPQLSVIRLMAAGYSSENRAISTPTDEDWETVTVGGESDMWGLPELLLSDILAYGFVLAVAVYVPFGGLPSTVAVDGATVTFTIRREV